MTSRYLRIVFLSEFLVAILAVFTAWSEIGGQAVLDAMPWGWKAGLGLGLAAIFVAFTASLGAGESIWNSRSAKWLALMIVVVLAMGVVTFYYTIQLETQPPDEQDGSSALLLTPPSPGVFSFHHELVGAAFLPTSRLAAGFFFINRPAFLIPSPANLHPPSAPA